MSVGSGCMLDRVYDYITQNNMTEEGDSVLLGLSGGADSMCMLYAMDKLKDRLGISLRAVYVNHHIRKEEAEEDGVFVRDACEATGISFCQVDVNIPEIVKKTGQSEEEAGRCERYRIFQELAERYGCSKIAVAHNKNDSAETILFNLFRGSGMTGISGISPVRGNIIRPLLCLSRSEIEGLLGQWGVQFRNDSTNRETKYSRNKIRLELLPYIEKNINSGAMSNIIRTGNHVREAESFVSAAAEEKYLRYVILDGKYIRVDDECFKEHAAVKKRIYRKVIERLSGSLKDVSSIHIDEITNLEGMAVSKTVDLPGDILARRDYNGIVFVRKERTADKNSLICDKETEKGCIIFAKGKARANALFDIEIKSAGDIDKELILRNNLKTKLLDYDKINVLEYRTRMQGDYMVINASGGRKKLKDIFIDMKLPREERDKKLLLADGQSIVWITGGRIGYRYRVTEDTEKVLEVTYKGQ